MRGRIAWRRALGAAVIAVAAMGGALARADEKVERFLPPETFLYGGVEKLGAAFDKVTALLRQTLPFLGKDLAEDRVIGALAQAFHLEGVATREQFAAATGLDLDGPAGIAWVLADPSFEPFRSVNENVLLVLPLKDPARAEKLLADAFLPHLPGISRNVCSSTCNRLRNAIGRWQEQNPAQAKEAPTWDDLAKANPGLKPLLCPAGGEYKLGPGEPACSVHTGEQPPQGPATRDTLGTKLAGDVTLVGGRAKGAGYAVTANQIVISNHMNVLEGAVAAAAGTGPRAALAPHDPGATADGRVFVHLGHLLAEGRGEVVRWAERRQTPNSQAASRRLMALLDGLDGLTLDLRVAEALAGQIGWKLHRNEATQAFLDIPPAKPEALAFVPDSALLAVGGNVARPIFNVIADAASLLDDRIGPVLKLIPPVCDGDGAFALTKGIFAEEIPNVLLILKARDREMAQSVAEAWVALIGRDMRLKGEPQKTEVGGVTVVSLQGERDMALHYAFAGPFFIGGTSLDDVKAAVGLQAGQAKDSFLAGERARKIELPEGPTSLVAFMDMPAFVRQMEANQLQRMSRWQNESCRQNLQKIEKLAAQFQAEQGKAPASLDELRKFAADPKRGQFILDVCTAGFGQQKKLALDPATGRISCPNHGTAADFKPVPVDLHPRQREEMAVFSAFGLWGLRLRVEGGRLVGEGRLIPAPQQPPPKAGDGF